MAEQKPQVSYDEFARMDIRVGTIIATERVPDTDKLIKCTINFGDPATGGLGERTIVSGIALFREAESLVGRQCTYIVNLAPRMIRGIESQGMLLAASTDDGTFALLSPDTELPPGTSIT